MTYEIHVRFPGGECAIGGCKDEEEAIAGGARYDGASVWPYSQTALLQARESKAS